MRRLFYEFVTEAVLPVAVAAVLVFGIVLCAVFFPVGVGRPGEGAASVMVLEVEHAGVLNKTWEIKVQEGTLLNGSGPTATGICHLTAPASLVPELQEALRLRRVVKIQYRTLGIWWRLQNTTDGNVLVAIDHETEADPE